MRLHFISGLPRSGSTLLTNILAQNPRFAVAGTSGLVDILLTVRNAWSKLSEFKACPNDAARVRVLRGIMGSYYGDEKRPVGFDKSRTWLAHLELVEHVLGRKVKVLVPVRDVRDILASLEAVWRLDSRTRQTPWEARDYPAFQTVAGRCAQWMKPDGVLGIAYNRLHDAFIRGLGDRLMLVPYEELTRGAPYGMLRDIYRFLGEDEFDHDLDNVQQVTHENDEAYGFSDLHTIRSKVEPSRPRWPELLGRAADAYANLNFWQVRGDQNADHATPAPPVANGNPAPLQAVRPTAPRSQTPSVADR